MPTIHYDAPPIIVPLTNWVQGKTEFLQEVVHHDLIVHDDVENRTCRVELHGTVYRFTIADDGSRGPQLTGKNMFPYPEMLVGLDDTICHHNLEDEETLGDIVIHNGKPAILNTGDNNGIMTLEEFEAVQALPIPTMKQANQFLWMRDHYKIGLRKKIMKHWATANQFGKFNAPA